MWYLLLLISGFVPLIIGANLLVENASSLAKRLNIPSMVIGLTILGFGTSSPELVVNLFASLEKNSDLALGNIIGSNILNILGLLGIQQSFILWLSRKTLHGSKFHLAFSQQSQLSCWQMINSLIK